LHKKNLPEEITSQILQVIKRVSAKLEDRTDLYTNVTATADGMQANSPKPWQNNSVSRRKWSAKNT